mmetsp:Transcript_32271/g.62052  ORF Transcript_32271/g.62052 Transcript_32271/m.62052 type:complete len:168 (+) Transcript_32271:35-538(+)
MTSRWRMDFGEERAGKRDLPNPLGYIAASPELEDAPGKKKGNVDVSLKQKKIWEIAQSPFKSIGMMAFMMWMSGNTVQIFSIGITMTGLVSPIKAILGAGPIFARFADKDTDVLLPRLLFSLIHLGGFGFALYKLSQLGLLPTHTSDWITPAVPKMAEYASGGTPLM